MLTQDQIIANGKHAGALMEDPILKEALKLTHAAIFEEWANTRPDQTSVREGLWAQIAAVERLIQTLNSIRNAGIVAEQNKLTAEKRASADKQA